MIIKKKLLFWIPVLLLCVTLIFNAKLSSIYDSKAVRQRLSKYKKGIALPGFRPKKGKEDDDTKFKGDKKTSRCFPDEKCTAWCRNGPIVSPFSFSTGTLEEYQEYFFYFF